ncbi:MAG TPA: hypothetical protein GX717_01120, partial [Clostridiaceae bacterium]|nr:hypothetical protein [Clostridiaceae bacterium]
MKIDIDWVCSEDLFSLAELEAISFSVPWTYEQLVAEWQRCEARFMVARLAIPLQLQEFAEVGKSMAVLEPAAAKTAGAS